MHGTGCGDGLVVEDGSVVEMLHSTIARNEPSVGISIRMLDDIFNDYEPSSLAMTNSLLVSHTLGISVADQNTLLLDGVLWHQTPITLSAAANTTVTIRHQHYGDPFLDSDGYHLRPGSAAINHGLPTGLSTDIDGQARDPYPDLGADELPWDYFHRLPLVTQQWRP